MTINILGQDYDLQEVGGNDDVRLSDDLDGYCDGWGKIIRLRNDYNTKNPCNVSDMEAYKRNVKRHEIIHAFLRSVAQKKTKTLKLCVNGLPGNFPNLKKRFNRPGHYETDQERFDQGWKWTKTKVKT